MALNQKELRINCFRGLDDIVFGMSPDEVIAQLGKAELSTAYTAINNVIAMPRQTEIRNKVKYFYEDDKLVCITGDLSCPFYLGENRIPFTFFEALRFLKSKSKLNFRFSNNTSYVFVDLGLVIYPYETIDIEAGTPTKSTKHRLSVCNMEVLKRYTQYFVDHQEKSGASGKYILSTLGEFAEEYDRDEEEK